MSRVLRDEHVRGRRDHTCVLCGETIRKGEVHRVCVYVDGGDGFGHHRTHEECDRVTVVDRWDEVDFEVGCEYDEFRARREELRAEGSL